MAKKTKKGAGLMDPTKLNPILKDENLLQVVIETPKGCRNKFAFDPEQGIFALKKVLPVGMAFPYDFGFLPGTMAEDGDPVDVLVLMDEPAYPGVLVKGRLLGVIEGEQVDAETKEKTRNDRIIAVAEPSHMYTDVKGMGDLSKEFVKEVGQFFVNYHNLEGKKFTVLGVKGEMAAMTLIKKGRKAA